VPSAPEVARRGLLNSDYAPVRGLGTSSGTLSSGIATQYEKILWRHVSVTDFFLEGVQVRDAVANDISKGLSCSADQMINFLFALCFTNQTVEKYAFEKPVLGLVRERTLKLVIEKDKYRLSFMIRDLSFPIQGQSKLLFDGLCRFWAKLHRDQDACKDPIGKKKSRSRPVVKSNSLISRHPGRTRSCPILARSLTSWGFFPP